MLTKRSLGLVLALLLASTSCGAARGSAGSPTGAPDVALPSAAPPEPAILGTWRTDYECHDLVRAFEDADVAEFAPEALVGLHMIEGPVDRLAAQPNLCERAVTIQRTNVFRSNGYLLSYQGSRLESDCHCFEVVGDHTFVNLADPGYPDIALDFEIVGDSLTFSVVVPDPCPARCVDQVHTAVGNYGVGTWHRVDQ